MISDGPKCEGCNKLIHPEEPHMMLSFKPHCIKCARQAMHADDEKLKDGKLVKNSPKDDGNKGMPGTAGGVHASNQKDKTLAGKKNYIPNKNAGIKPV